MSDISYDDQIRLERMFNMGSGLVLQLTDSDLQNLVKDHIGVNILDSKFEFADGSQASRLRTLWNIESNESVGRLLLALLKEWKRQKKLHNYPISDSESKLFIECKKIAQALVFNRENSNASSELRVIRESRTKSRVWVEAWSQNLDELSNNLKQNPKLVLLVAMLSIVASVAGFYADTGLKDVIDSLNHSDLEQMLIIEEPIPNQIVDVSDGCASYTAISSFRQAAMIDVNATNTFLDETEPVLHRFISNLKYFTIKLTSVERRYGEWLQISADAKIVVDNYQSLEYVDIFFVEPFFAMGGCGGGGSARRMSKAHLNGFSTTKVSHDDFDFFSLKPGEFEVLAFPISCEKPGLYKFHIEVQITSTNQERTFNSVHHEFLCPAYKRTWIGNKDKSTPSTNRLMFAGIESLQEHTDDTTNEVTYEYNLDPALYDFNRFSEYQLGYANSYCNGDRVRESYIPLEGVKRIRINPMQPTDVPLLLEPASSPNAYAFIRPGAVLAISGEYYCGPDAVWWKVSDDGKENRSFDETAIVGWVAEFEGQQQLIFPCFPLSNICNYDF